MTYSFIVPGRMPNLNDFILAERTVIKSDPRRHILVTKGAVMKKKWQSYVVAYIRKDLKGLKIAKQIDIKYKYFEPNQKRDKGNIHAFADKVICDALQDAKTIANDNWKYIRNISMEFYVDANNPRIEVYLTEVE